MLSDCLRSAMLSPPDTQTECPQFLLEQVVPQQVDTITTHTTGRYEKDHAFFVVVVVYSLDAITGSIQLFIENSHTMVRLQTAKAGGISSKHRSLQ